MVGNVLLMALVMLCGLLVTVLLVMALMWVYANDNG